MRLVSFSPLAACLVLSAATSAPVPKVAVKPASYCNTTVGSTFIYKEDSGNRSASIAKVHECDDGSLVTIKHVSLDGETIFETLKVCPTGLFRVGFGEDKFDPPVCILAIPAEVGKKWTTEALGGRLTISGKTNAIVSAIEMVIVPAGQFEAIRVERCFTPKTGGEEIVSIIWFTQDIGIIKSKSGEKVSALAAILPPTK